MATRRPASRARLNSSSNPPMAPPQLSRPRSVLSKLTSSSRSDDAHKDPSSLHPNKQSKSSDDSETNIQVVIRCRRRSDREVQDNSPIIVTSAGARTKEISIETSAPVSSLGVVTLPPIRTYPFDLVFGPEADQALIYHDVVHPMLEEVLMGYNCTLFAYGQTGTGKTHTMQGDLVPTPMGNPSANAGMIPRVLFRLFHQLESTNADYSVKVSFIELYNEDLRDLLAEDFSAPSGSTQPMGMAAKDKNQDNALKIFDDATKRGVFIQGLEEIPVKDSKDALALLTKGSLRRQIAATKFNDHSSRSHSVFSITVHIKEASAAGEDLLKTGKLNLVDLAGSENIGRSGAENKRAREAGMINQSLLTLGRVINALVDKAQHVPYRESKLTRLLQDSLGGRTKTCIIATISPARSNMEETLSTLDYAMRAKSIRNKPELNQRMTRNSLLKEYVAEIERLKADLLAAREKNGIFFSEETWNQLNSEQELRQTELEEAKKQVEIVESQMRSVREEFEQSIALLMKTDGELRETKKKLSGVEVALIEKEGELGKTKEELMEEIIVRKAHQETEVALDRVAIGLKEIAAKSLQDVEGLFDKLDRKSQVLTSNSRLVSKNEKVISGSTNSLSQIMADFSRNVCQPLLKLRAQAKDFGVTETTSLASHSAQMSEQLCRIQGMLNAVSANDVSEAKELEKVRIAFNDSHEAIREEVDTWSSSVKEMCGSLCKQVETAAKEQFSALGEAMTGMGQLLEGIVQETGAYINAERQSSQEAMTLANDTAAQEISHLRQQNEALLRILVDERTKASKAKDVLIQRISGMLGEYEEQKDIRLQKAIEDIHSQNLQAQETIQTFSTQHAEILSGMESNAAKTTDVLQQRRRVGKRTRDGALKALTDVQKSFSNDLGKLESTISNSAYSHSTRIQSQAQAAIKSCNNSLEEHSTLKRARLHSTQSMGSELEKNYELMQNEVASTSRSIKTYSEHTMQIVSELERCSTTHQTAASQKISSIQQAAHALAKKANREDEPTGNTPQKHKWDYDDHWELTGSREVVLKNWSERLRADPDSFSNSAFKEERQDCLPIESTKLSPEADVDNILEQDGNLVRDEIAIPDFESRPVQKATSNDIVLLPMGTLVDSRKRNVYPTRASRRP